jgi:lipoprotein-anchoring transpeptidase ErfK/SrfK
MSAELRIEVDLGTQRLRLLRGDEVLREYSVSTAKNGAGERMDTGCTPRGRHVITEKIGEGAMPGTVFVGRRPTGEIYSPELRKQNPTRDWIVTRILWLSGAEPGRNQGGEVDTYNRYIYIHGAPDDVPMGVPGSAGCIRMRNADVIELFDRVPPGTPVLIRE